MIANDSWRPEPKAVREAVIADDLWWSLNLDVWTFLIADDPRVGAELGRFGACDHRRAPDRRAERYGRLVAQYGGNVVQESLAQP